MPAANEQNKSPRKFILGPRCHVVVVGANFAGMKAVSALPKDFKVTAVDPGPFFEFLPNIHELLSGVKRPRNLRLPRRDLIEGFGHRFLNDSVETIEPEKNRISTAGGKRLYYDFCVVATGGINNTFGVEGADDQALPFKSVDDCAAIAQRLEKAAGSRRKASVVIVGGGLEGVEALGEILRKYKNDPDMEIQLVEKGERLLPGFMPSLDKEIRRLCENCNVLFRTSETVEKVEENRAILSSGEDIPSDLVIWTGGAKAPPLLERSGLAHPGEWAPVRASLQSERFDNLFVAGDAASLPFPLGKQAYYAMDLGVLAAENIQHLANGDSPADFQPYSRPSVVAFGDLSTFMIGDKLALAGAALAAAKESVFQIAMARMDRPTRLGAYFDAFGRAKSGVGGLFLPSLTSFSALRRLTGVKLLV